MKNNKLIAFLVLIGVVALWGVAPVISKAIFNDNTYSPGILIALRGIFAIVAMAAFINKDFKKINKSYWVCIPAGLILAAAYLFQFIGLNKTHASKNAFLENISCITIPLFMFIFVREKPTWYSILSACICVVGSIFLVGSGFDLRHFFNEDQLLGDGLSAIGGLFFGLDIAFTKVFCKDKDPRIYVFLQLCVLTVVAFAYSMIFEVGLGSTNDFFDEFAISFKFTDILLVIFLGVICTAVCWVARAWAMKSIDAVTVSLLVPLSAVIASILSIAFKFETFTYNLLVGGLIILLSIAISAVFDYRKGCQPNNTNNEQQPNEEVVTTDEPDQSQL